MLVDRSATYSTTLSFPHSVGISDISEFLIASQPHEARRTSSPGTNKFGSFLLSHRSVSEGKDSVPLTTVIVRSTGGIGFLMKKITKNISKDAEKSQYHT